MLEPALVTREQAGAFIKRLHRHHDPDQGDRFCLGAWDTERDRLCGVAVVGRPRAPALQNRYPWLLEVTRVCTDGTRNACSFLYANATRVAEARGWTAVITYTLRSEGGASLRALGWWPEELKPRTGIGWENREGRAADGVHGEVRWLWMSRFEFHALPEVEMKKASNQFVLLEPDMTWPPCCMGLAAMGVCTCPPKPRVQPDRVARVICSRFLAGESVPELADDYGITQADVLATLRAWLRLRGEARKGRRG